LSFAIGLRNADLPDNESTEEIGAHMMIPLPQMQDSSFVDPPTAPVDEPAKIQRAEGTISRRSVIMLQGVS